MIRHLSVSSHNPAKVPGPEVMQMVARAFGFSGPHGASAAVWADLFAGRIWLEEYEPGKHAVNVAEVSE